MEKDAAYESGIPALVRFAELKEKRLEGLIAHAVGYGYRDEDYFFSLIRCLSLPSVRCQSPKKT